MDSISKKLIDVLCAATGQPHPQYYTITQSRIEPGKPAFVPKTSAIVAQFDISLRTPTILSVGVFDANGMYIEKPIERKLYPEGQNNISITFDTEPYGPGQYSIKLIGAKGVLQEKKVVAEK